MMSLLIILAGCSQNDQHQSDKGSKNQSTTGKTPYHRIVSLMPSNTEILYELGLEIVLWVCLPLMTILKC